MTDPFNPDSSPQPEYEPGRGEPFQPGEPEMPDNAPEEVPQSTLALNA